jgi:hypothetical protein
MGYESLSAQYQSEVGVIRYDSFVSLYLVYLYRVSQNWRTNYLLPYRRCLNVHEKKFSEKKKQLLLLLLLLTVIQCKQRYTRTSLPCNVAVVDLR